MKAQFLSNAEFMIFVAEIEKITRFNTAQKRTLVLTNQAVYIFQQGEMNRRNAIKNMKALIRSSSPQKSDSSECVLVSPYGKDLRFRGLSEASLSNFFRWI